MGCSLSLFLSLLSLTQARLGAQELRELHLFDNHLRQETLAPILGALGKHGVLRILDANYNEVWLFPGFPAVKPLTC